MVDVSANDWMLQNIIFMKVPHGRGSFFFFFLVVKFVYKRNTFHYYNFIDLYCHENFRIYYEIDHLRL
jgi:hypothetical protein